MYQGAGIAAELTSQRERPSCGAAESQTHSLALQASKQTARCRVLGAKIGSAHGLGLSFLAEFTARLEVFCWLADVIRHDVPIWRIRWQMTCLDEPHSADPDVPRISAS